MPNLKVGKWIGTDSLWKDFVGAENLISGERNVGGKHLPLFAA